MSMELEDDRRSGLERRHQPTSVWDAIWGRGHRALVRRQEERQLPHFLDRFPTSTFIWIVLLLGFTVADGYLTLELVDSGYHEINPVMHYFLSKSPSHFMIGKYILAAAGLPVLVLFGRQSPVKYTLPVFVSLYAVLVTYQLVLLFGTPQ